METAAAVAAAVAAATGLVLAAGAVAGLGLVIAVFFGASLVMLPFSLSAAAGLVMAFLVTVVVVVVVRVVFRLLFADVDRFSVASFFSGSSFFFRVLVLPLRDVLVDAAAAAFLASAGFLDAGPGAFLVVGFLLSATGVGGGGAGRPIGWPQDFRGSKSLSKESLVTS